MPDESSQPFSAEPLTYVHLTGLVSSSISKDGKTAMVVFTVDDEDSPKFAVTCNVELLPWLRMAFQDALAKLPPKRIGEHTFLMFSRGPSGEEQIDVSVSKDAPVPVILRMNPDRAEELDFGISADTALRLATILNELPAKLKEIG